MRQPTLGAPYLRVPPGAISSADTKFIRYSCLAALSGLMALVSQTDYGLVSTCMLSLTGGLYGLATLLNAPDTRVNFLLVSAVVISLASSLGMLFGYVTLSFVSDGVWDITLEHAYTTSADLSLAQGYTSTFAIALWLLGRYWQRSGMMRAIYQDVDVALQTYKPTVMLISIIALMCQLYLFDQTIVVYGGRDLASEGEPTHPLQAFIGPLVPVLPFVFAYYTRHSFITRRWITGLLFICLLLAELSWFFLFGRRSVFYFFVLVSFGFTYERIITGKYIARHIVAVTLGVILALTIADTYHKMRTVYGFATLQRMKVMDGVSGLQTIDSDQYSSLRMMNLAFRSVYSSLALGQFINLFRTTAHKPLAGHVLMNSVKLATPSDFIVDKKSIPAKELLYQSAYALPITDISETLYLESFIDFGWLGWVLYTGSLFLVFSGVYLVAFHYGNPLFSLIVSCISLSLALSMVESDMITVLAHVRTLFVYYGLTRLFFRKIT